MTVFVTPLSFFIVPVVLALILIIIGLLFFKKEINTKLSYFIQLLLAIFSLAFVYLLLWRGVIFGNAPLLYFPIAGFISLLFMNKKFKKYKYQKFYAVILILSGLLLLIFFAMGLSYSF